MKVEGIEVSRTLDAEGKDLIVITWDTSVPGCEAVKGFNIYRSLSSEESTFEKINFSLISSGTNYYLDTLAGMKLGVTFYYKVTSVNYSDVESSLLEADMKFIWGEKEKKSDMFSSLSYVAIGRAIQNLDMTGQLGAIFLRIRYGDRCSQCYDDMAGYSVNRNCTVCFGTGFENGYVKISKRIIFTRGGMRYMETESGFKESRSLTAHIDNYPIVHPGDMIVNAGNDRFIVNSVNPTKIRDVLISQEMDITFLNRDNPLYNVVGRNE